MRDLRGLADDGEDVSRPGSDGRPERGFDLDVVVDDLTGVLDQGREPAAGAAEFDLDDSCCGVDDGRCESGDDVRFDQRIPDVSLDRGDAQAPQVLDQRRVRESEEPASLAFRHVRVSLRHALDVALVDQRPRPGRGGRARLEVDGTTIEAGPGSILYVGATAEHSFFEIEEEMTLLVFFATGGTSGDEP